ncbi:MAG: PhnD/SsuA/transferrin family substrate-binding protein [Paracoccaceae bacterium]|jgi:ABC-type phosphate/phosphonate transport system substrate-binding protein|nr:PhnD/SsuA/transferrin family substrate-binding protein [Paracoccaceae bacterium]
MIAALGMYDRPETAHANDAFWALFREALGDGPKSLTRDMVFWDIWQSSDLLLSQTCGLPYRAHLHDNVQLVGTPDYGIDGCEAGYYRSVIVSRKGSGVDMSDLSSLRLGYNDRLSQSGWAAFWAHVPKGSKPKELIKTGGHAASAKAVADGEVDIATLDALTWRLIHQFDDFAEKLTVLEQTSPTPGLPYITALSRDPKPIRNAVVHAIHALPSDLRALLHLKGFVQIPKAKYLEIPMPPG